MLYFFFFQFWHFWYSIHIRVMSLYWEQFVYLRFMQLIFGISHRPFPRQRIVGTCLWIKPVRHWYLTSELISYRSRVFPKERAFSTTGGWLQATANQTRQRHLIRNFTGTMGLHFYPKKIWKWIFCLFVFYLCPSCRWKWGGSCKEHHSTDHPHAISSPHSPRQQRRSCQAGWASSFHIAIIRAGNRVKHYCY